jgi:hypothetical protein
MKIWILTVFTFIIQICHGQATLYKNELIDLAKIYRNFHFSNNPPSNVFEQLGLLGSPELVTSKKFISEIIKTNNQICTKEYLTKPDSITLKSLYIIRGLNWNMHEANAVDNKLVVDSLITETTDYNELLACYYGMLFTAVGNKNKPFNMADYNFNLGEYNLQNDTEKGIFFLESMNMFGTLIWGYMNIPKPPNYKLALDYIDKYPTYNSQPYYQYLDLNFKDFNLTTDKRKPKESFKKYLINKYMNTLIYHCLCLSQKKKNEQKRSEILLGSILRNESYWDYFDNKEVLASIFQKVKE